jgi:hypothetical protein
MVWKRFCIHYHKSIEIGIYFSSSADYSTHYVQSDTCTLLLCYVIVANPYPVIYDDATSKQNLVFYGKGNYKNYGCHYVPIIPYSEVDFLPPPIGLNLILTKKLKKKDNLHCLMRLLYFKKNI